VEPGQPSLKTLADTRVGNAQQVQSGGYGPPGGTELGNVKLLVITNTRAMGDAIPHPEFAARKAQAGPHVVVEHRKQLVPRGSRKPQHLNRADPKNRIIAHINSVSS
jgi:hypothetical protein